MAKIAFETLSFEEKQDGVEVVFLKLFSFSIPRERLEAIAEFRAEGNSIEFMGAGRDEARSRLNILLAEGFESLKSRLTGKNAVYVHKKSGIPLVGNIAFGIVDRNTSIIEVKPVTSCNLKCIYCSVNDDIRPTDFVVEKGYITQELRKILDYKKEEGMEIHIGGQAEPLYYADLANLVMDVSKLPRVSEISMDTNGTLLTKRKVDGLVEAGMTRFNLSINAMEQKLAEKIAGSPYNLKKVLEIAEYISKKADLIIAPVWVPGINDDEIPKLIEFAQKLRKKSKNKVMVGVQNFLNYRFGRNPAKQMSWGLFRERLGTMEKKYNEHLILDLREDFNIRQTKPLPKPFRKGSKIDAEIVCDGRIAGEKIAVANNRTITLPNCSKEGKVRVKITRTKHNIFYGSCL